MSRNGDIDSHRQNRPKPADELADVIARFWAHNGNDEQPTTTATDEEMARFILANYAEPRR